MRIAIQSADLDNLRIDGSRVYLLNLLNNFGKISQEDEFLILHRKNFYSELTPHKFPNYKEIKKDFPFFWTQTRFAWNVFCQKADVLWMPMHNIPILRRKKTKTFVTIHDLAFKLFPDHFPKNDLRRLNILTDLAIRKSDKIIAVSNSTKKDILKFYPEINEDKIKVIYHGFDRNFFNMNFEKEKVYDAISKFGLKNKNYFLYSGAIQPRKNLEILVDAFNIFKKETGSDYKLVIAGEKAWLWEDFMEKVNKSSYKKDIILTGKLKFCDLGMILRGAGVYVYPSLYEGFGITILEAMASGVPVLTSNNSSLPEVAGETALYFDSQSSSDLSNKMKELIFNEEKGEDLIKGGLENIKKFSWEKCARETLHYLKS